MRKITPGKTKVNKKYFVMLLISALLISLVIVNHVRAQDNGIQEEYETWNVRKGDTLWKIASLNRGKTEIRKYIYQIQKLNDIGSAIYPGQQIMLP